MKTYLTAALVFLFAIGLTSCSCSQTKFDSNKATSEKIMSTLNNTQWVLQRIDIQNRDFKPTEEQPELVLSFVDNFYSTSDGCNGKGGEFEAEDNKITLKSGMSTMRYCGEEMAYLIYDVPLHTAKAIKIKKEQLQLFNEEGAVVATYVKKK